MNVLRPLVFALSLSLALIPNAARCGWGLEVDRASFADLNDLAHAEQALWSSEKAIAYAVGKATVTERQLELLGIPSDPGLQRLFHLAFAWWLKSVLKPAAQIEVNPAASCAEAKLALTKLLELERQRQLMGLAPGEAGPADASVVDADSLIKEIDELVLQATTRRCHEEALDECVYTGRVSAVMELALSEERQGQLFGKGTSDSSWVKDALDQCAIYKLKFTSTGSVSQTANQEGYKREVEGTVVVRQGLPGGLPGGGLPGLDMVLLLMGTDSTAHLSSVTCQGTDPAAVEGRVVVDFCGYAGINKGPTTVMVKALDLSHFTYDVDGIDFTAPGRDKVKMTVVGQDQLTLMFVPGAISVAEQSHLEIQGRRLPSTDSTPEVFASIYQGAHINQGNDVVFPPGGAPDALSHRKSAYPVLLRHTHNGTSPPGARSEIYKDTTEFEFSHQPEPKSFAPRDTSTIVRIDQKINELAALP